jgi:hypothetical protein
MLSYFNTRHQRIGHVFHGRYKAILCDGNAYLLELVRLYPSQSSSSRLTVAPQSYLWSSHKDYIGDLRESIVDTKHIPPQFGRTHREAKQHFNKFMLGRLHDGKREDFYGTTDQRFLGDDQFIEAIKDTIGEFAMQKAMRGVSGSADLLGLLPLVAGLVDLSESDIRGPTQQRTAYLYLSAM